MFCFCENNSKGIWPVFESVIQSDLLILPFRNGDPLSRIPLVPEHANRLKISYQDSCHCLGCIDRDGAHGALWQHKALLEGHVLAVVLRPRDKVGAHLLDLNCLAVLLDVDHPARNPLGLAPLVDVVPLIRDTYISILAVRVAVREQRLLILPLAVHAPRVVAPQVPVLGTDIFD